MCVPSTIQLHKVSKTLTLCYGKDSYGLPAEFLRMHSSSVEAQGHGNPVLQYGKLNAGLVSVEPTGRYTPKLNFDDDHDNGLFTWDYLYELATRKDQLQTDYLTELASADKSCDPDESVAKLVLRNAGPGALSQHTASRRLFPAAPDRGTSFAAFALQTARLGIRSAWSPR